MNLGKTNMVSPDQWSMLGKVFGQIVQYGWKI